MKRIALLISLLQLIAANVAAQTTFALAGDLMMGTNFPDDSNGAYLAPDNGRRLFDHTAPVFKAAHVAAINLEGTMFDGQGKPKKCNDPSICYLFRTPEAFAPNLVNAGIDLVNLANNHINDFGIEGRNATMATLRRSRLAHAGLREECPYTIIERNGKKIGFIGFATNRGTLNIMDYAQVEQSIADLKKQCDIVLASFHGGGEGTAFTHVPHGMEECYGEKRGNVEKFAHKAIEAGADLVMGHGPHVTRALELYHGRLIIYSLGNFCTPYRVNIQGISGHAPIVEATLADDGSFISGKIHPFIQVRGAGPRPDTSGKVIDQIRRLTIADFPSTPLTIAPDGAITKKR